MYIYISIYIRAYRHIFIYVRACSQLELHNTHIHSNLFILSDDPQSVADKMNCQNKQGQRNKYEGKTDLVYLDR